MDAADLKAFRKRHELTQGELAGRMGLSLRQYQDLEGSAAPIRLPHRIACWAIDEHALLEQQIAVIEKGEVGRRALPAPLSLETLRARHGEIEQLLGLRPPGGVAG